LITLYTWCTPNGRKISIMLEELGLTYQVKLIDIGRDEQFAPAFLQVSPNNKIPALVDEDAAGGPLAVFESGAILIYLAEKTGQLLPSSGPARYRALEWLQWSIGGLGPMLGQLVHFANPSLESAPGVVQRFTDEAGRLLGVLNRRLDESPFLGGDAYSIADIAAYTWTGAAATRLVHVLAPALKSADSIHRWLEAIGARAAVHRGMNVPLDA